MHARALTRALIPFAAIAIGATLLTATPAYAVQAESQAPVVVNDTITVWPGQVRQIDVLANDTDPDGDDLALCRFPEPDFTSGRLPRVLVMPGPTGADDSAGSLLVVADPRARGTHTIDYHVCDYDVLVPATLTVVVRDVAPVTVAKVAGKPGKLKVTNENEKPIRFCFGHPNSSRTDGRVSIPAHDTVTVKVQRKRIFWIGVIGRGGIADFGVVNHIKLKGDPLPAPHSGAGDLRADAASLLKRWLG